jgi:hypothetical protein
VKQEVAGAAENTMQFEVWIRIRRWLKNSGIGFEEIGDVGAVLKPGPTVSAYGMSCYVEPMTISIAVVRFYAMIGFMQQIEANILALRWILRENSNHIVGALALNVDGLVAYKYDMCASGMKRTHFVHAMGSMIALVPKVRSELPGVCIPGTFSLIHER